MPKLRRESDLLLESAEIDLGAQVGWEHLRHDHATELCVAADEDARHPSAVQLTFDRVARRERRHCVETGVRPTGSISCAKELQHVELLRRVVVCLEQSYDARDVGIVRIESSNARGALVGREVDDLIEEESLPPRSGIIPRLHSGSAPSANRAASHARA
jgi:hypothetical protein